MMMGLTEQRGTISKGIRFIRVKFSIIITKSAHGKSANAWAGKDFRKPKK